jgi:hypothetical protein
MRCLIPITATPASHHHRHMVAHSLSRLASPIHRIIRNLLCIPSRARDVCTDFQECLCTIKRNPLSDSRCTLAVDLPISHHLERRHSSSLVDLLCRCVILDDTGSPVANAGAPRSARRHSRSLLLPVWHSRILLCSIPRSHIRVSLTASHLRTLTFRLHNQHTPIAELLHLQPRIEPRMSTLVIWMPSLRS